MKFCRFLLQYRDVNHKYNFGGYKHDRDQIRESIMPFYQTFSKEIISHNN